MLTVKPCARQIGVPLNMQHREFEPPLTLTGAIKCFWHNTGDFGEQPVSFEVVPDGYAEIIFYFGSLSVIDNKGNQEQLPSPFIIGLLNQPVVFYTRRQLNIIAIRCYPWAVFNLLGLQPGKDGVRAFEHPIVQLQPILHKLVKDGNIHEAVEQVTQYLLKARPGIAINSMLYKAGVAMRIANGTIPVSKVAATAHATVRTLERNFKQSSGHTVKDVSALMRFEHVRNQLWINPYINLAGLAAEAGYTDQSHLSREFKRFSGTSPAAFARNAKQGKQVFTANFVAFVQA